MMLKNLALGLCCFILLCASTVGWAEIINNPSRHTLQINTNFTSVIGKPSWLLIMRDTETGQVWPYLFDIREKNNSWVAFVLGGKTYKITASTLTFGPLAIVRNFCHLEDGVIESKSFFITITGALSPDPNAMRCNILKYRDAL